MKGIMFCELLHNKTVAGEKTMTRREHGLKKINDNPDEWHICGTTFGGEWTKAIMPTPVPGKWGACKFGFSRGSGLINYITPEIEIKPHYKVGEVVYIKEPVADYFVGLIPYINGVFGDRQTVTAYKYGLPEHQAVVYSEDGPVIVSSEGLEWKNKMFIGSDKGRNYIRITGVKVERLFDISDEDCMKEGVEMDYFTDEDAGYMMEPMYMDYHSMKMDLDFYAKKSFFSLFRFANKIPKSRDIKNIWCFAYSYHLCDKEGNKI